KDLNGSFDRGVPFDRAPYAEASCAWEQKWSRQTVPAFRTEPLGDPVRTAERLVKQWAPVIRGAAR
ncbi:MAG TPA: hypothetical protein VFT41_12175, partial [Gemmatimonadaceae bacterium]|nr:hypothetical protein [Gemmatimonadaceae bacterium]